MSVLDPWYEARESMVDAVVADLYGTDDDAVLDEAPLDRFIVGILHPQSLGGDDPPAEFADEVPEDASANDDAPDDPGVSFAHLRRPSSMGLTFGVTPASTLRVEVEATSYKPESTGEARPDGEVATRGQGRRGRWLADRLGAKAFEFSTAAASHTVEVTEGLSLRVLVRPARHGVVSATIVLVNTAAREGTARADELCWFRPRIRVKAVGGSFVDRRPIDALSHLDEDEQSGALLYRRERNLAVGHGVAVEWVESPSVEEITTTFFPAHELPLAKADRDDVPSLRMDVLAAGTPESLDMLDRLVERYRSWIVDQRTRMGDIPEANRDAASRHLSQAEQAADRIERGIALLREEPEAALAFTLMNKAMAYQRVRQEMLRRNLDEPPEVRGEWRPFQIAFILLNLEGLFHPHSAERDIADLLWFPTGGGKTEAYLGLIAFVLTLRRIRGVGENGDGSGVGVIMRYTLRLLTIQQFERAAGLICALEFLRREEDDLAAAAPYSIGLWVGQGATPNNVEDARAALARRRRGEGAGDKGDPMQLLRCPWCGAPLGPHEYDTDIRRDRLTVRCPGTGCPFSQGLPVHLVDSDVYSERPSLVIGTVDKFAMLAWNERSGRLFGSAIDAPPDLIIQDELHLISGPLGTLVGLYETAVDHLATSDDGVRPKLVASTATIRRSESQVRAVFTRQSRQFPPPGLDAGDSFFAVDAARGEKGTRKYVGLMAPSASHATLLVRTYAALLQAGHELQAPDEVRDAYWTLLGYFNSLRVLGAAYIQSIDDVRDRLRVVAARNHAAAREIRDPRELTSRVPSTGIPLELEIISRSYPHAEAADIVLATNMISVGVDVDRLGLMAVMGQPQTTSEYIQATSRVGRRYPGLVFTLYNASRSRDLSHYESFTSYHRALYRQVEATGATPFASRALDRGLHGLLVALARHTIPGAADDASPGIPIESGRIDDLVEIVRDRARAAGEDDAKLEEVTAALRSLIAEWETAVDSDLGLQRYGKWRSSSTFESLMVPAGSDMVDDGEPLIESFPPGEPPWPTLTSLRNVDRESTLRIIPSKRKVVGNDAS